MGIEGRKREWESEFFCHMNEFDGARGGRLRGSPSPSREREISSPCNSFFPPDFLLISSYPRDWRSFCSFRSPRHASRLVYRRNRPTGVWDRHRSVKFLVVPEGGFRSWQIRSLSSFLSVNSAKWIADSPSSPSKGPAKKIPRFRGHLAPRYSIRSPAGCGSISRHNTSFNYSEGAM